jgi:hypothetical protein
MTVCMAVTARAQMPFYTVSQDDFYQAVTNADTYERPLIDNTLRKTGSGTLTLQNPRMTRAVLEVLEGGVAVSLTNAFVPPALPDALRQKASFWVDANTNVVEEGGKVVRWHDVREASVDGPYSYMMATNAEVARQPTCVSDAALGGKKYLDFGVWGVQDTNPNSRWLFWAGTNGLEKTLELRSVFIVFGSHNGNSGGGGIMLIQNATILSPAPSAPFAGGSGGLWINSANVIADDGINYLDRQMRDGHTIQIFDKAYHLIECFTLLNAKANTFAKDRIYPGYSGGSRICEGLFFTVELTEAERLQVQDYLWHKWFSRSGEASLGTFRLTNGSALDVATGTNDVRSTVVGQGTVSKSGTGTLFLQNGGTDAFDGTVRLREGGLFVAGEPFLFEVEEGGQTLYAQDINVIRTAASAGRVVKTGSGELAVASVAAGVEAVEVAAGTLRLATPRTADAAPASEAAVNEWSLEGTLPSGDNMMYKNTTYAGWTFTQDTNTYPVVQSHVGVVTEAATIYNVIPGSIPDGRVMLYLNRGAAETTFDVAEAGLYRLEFFAAARTGAANLWVEVSVDGVLLNTFVTITPTFARYTLYLPFLAAGTHTVKFQGNAPGTITSRAAFVDAIRVVQLPVLAVVSNGNFELPVAMIEAGTVVTNEPAGLGWTFSGLAGIGRIQSNGSVTRSMPRTVPEGIAAAMLPLAGSIRQQVTFPTSGVYRLSFSAAARVGLVNHTFNVLLDGKLVRPFKMTDTAFQRYELTLPPVETGAELELAFVGTGAVNTASLIDDILIERIGADESVDALKNGGFEHVTTINPLVTTNWACTSLAGVYSNVNAWGETVPYGTYLGYTSMTHSFSQTVTFAASGDTVLRFLTKTRSAYPLPQYHDFEVTLNGERVGHVFNMGGDLRSYELPLPPVTAGVPYTLQFKGLQTYAVPSVSMYDEIAIVPAPAARARQSVTGRFPETTALDIASGAELVLDFEGEIKVKDVRYAGHFVSGTIDVTTHPEFVSGTGSILSPSKGTVISIR